MFVWRSVFYFAGMAFTYSGIIFGVISLIIFFKRSANVEKRLISSIPNIHDQEISYILPKTHPNAKYCSHCGIYAKTRKKNCQYCGNTLEYYEA